MLLTMVEIEYPSPLSANGKAFLTFAPKETLTAVVVDDELHEKLEKLYYGLE